MRAPTVVIVLAISVVAFCPVFACGSPEAEMLYDDLLSTYNRLIRPVGNNTDKLTVKLGLRLTQILDIDERNQIVTTNVWLKQQWQDYKLLWDPADYDGVSVLYVPSQLIWLPDIVLYNNADGDYQITLMTKATLYPNGTVMWEPPAIYKSFCDINVEYFPYDEQICKLKFGSWTYDGYEVDLVHEDGLQIVPQGIDLSEYHLSAEWDVLGVPAQRNELYYPCCSEPYPDVTFTIKIRRKTLFYTVNLIVPCIAISFLTLLVFYLPADSKQKVTLCITIMQSITVFFLLLSEIIPQTSLTVPLIGRYLLFTMILVTLSTIVTVIVINVHRGGSAKYNKLSPLVRRVFLNYLPRVLRMRKLHLVKLSGSAGQSNVPVSDTGSDLESTASALAIATFIAGPSCSTSGKRGSGYSGYSPVSGSGPDPNRLHVLSYRAVGKRLSELTDDSGDYSQVSADDDGMSMSVSAGTGPPPGSPSHRQSQMSAMMLPSDSGFSQDIVKALRGVVYIEKHMRYDDARNALKEEWKYVAMVLDRLFLWIFTVACIAGVYIIMQAPTFYDNEKPLEIQHH